MKTTSKLTILLIVASVTASMLNNVSKMPCVTSDILPTLLDLLDLRHPAPERPLDGISLRPLIMGEDGQDRPTPIGFWKYPASGENKNGRWVSEELSRGTTPTTRNPAIDFTNFKHPIAKTQDFGGNAAWTDNRYKLVSIPGKQGRRGSVELYDLQADPKETKDVSVTHPEIVERMKRELEAWQRSVEKSLTGADYE